MATQHFSVRTDAATLERLDALAARLDRSRNYLVNEAIGGYLRRQQQQIDRIEAGLADEQKGRVTAHDRVTSALRTSIDKRSRAQ